MTHRDGLPAIFGKDRAVQRCAASQGVRDAARKSREAAVSVAYEARRRASKNLADAQREFGHRLRFFSYPTDCICDLYGSLSMFLGIGSSQSMMSME
jgi:hypothetical protein